MPRINSSETKLLWTLHLLAPLLLPLSLLSSFWLVRLPALTERRLLTLGLVCDVLIVFGLGSAWAQLSQGEDLHRGQIEISYLGVDPQESSAGQGVVIKRARPGTAAERAGLRAGDRVRAIDGTALHTAAMLLQVMRRQPVGQAVALDVQHADGRRLTLALKPDRSWADNARTQLLRAVCAYSCLVLAVLLLALVAFRAHQAGVRGRWPLLLGGWFATMLPGLPLKLADYGVIPAPHQTSLLFCGELLLLFAALGLWRTMDAHDPASPLPERDVPYTFFVGAAFTASWLTRCGLLLAAVSFRFDVNIGPSQSFVSMLERPHSGAEQWLLGATVALLAPIAEELLFRGALFGWLNRFLSPWSSIGVSAALFTAAHAPTHGGYLLHIAALAVVFGWMRYRSGSLHPSMMLHVAINAAAFLQILRS